MAFPYDISFKLMGEEDPRGCLSCSANETSIFNRLKRKVAEESALDVSKRRLTAFLTRFYPQVPLPDLESVTNADLVDSVLQAVIQADDEGSVRAALARLTH